MLAGSNAAARSDLQRPSMAQDMAKGRRTEIEFMNGFIAGEGRRSGRAGPNACHADRGGDACGARRDHRRSGERAGECVKWTPLRPGAERVGVRWGCRRADQVTQVNDGRSHCAWWKSFPTSP